MLAVAIAAGALAGCQTAQQPQRAELMLWLRTDGQRISGNPAYESQAKGDLAACQRDIERAGITGIDITEGAIAAAAMSNPRNRPAIDIARNCMGARGYALVPQSEAAATLASFAARAGTG
jgi:hypothetical protein